jgi:formate hydrogenlyase transcriptional activator
MEFINSQGTHSICALPLTTSQHRLGALSLGSEKPDAYSKEEVRFLTLVADIVALAVDNALNFEASHLTQERLKLLLDVTNTVVSNLELRDLLRAVAASIRRVMHCDSVSVLLPDSESNKLRVYALDFPESKGFLKRRLSFPSKALSLEECSERASSLCPTTWRLTPRLPRDWPRV